MEKRKIYCVLTEKGSDRHFFATKEQAEECLNHPERLRCSKWDKYVMRETEIQKKHKWYAVYISDISGFLLESDAMYCEAPSESAARRRGETYIRQWQCEGRIQAIREVC